MAENGFERFLRKTLGVGQGQLRLRLVKTNVRAGERLVGRVELAPVEPLDGRSLRVGVRAVQAVVERNFDRRGVSVTNREHVLYDHFIELDGQRTYRAEGFDFTLTLPSAQPQTGGRGAMPDGALGDVVKLVEALRDTRHLPIKWVVQARLVVPWKIDLSAEQTLDVSF